MRTIIYLLALILCFAGCSSEPNVIVVPDNTAPPDNSIPSILQETYISKIYINLLGRKPSDDELNNALSILEQGSVSVDSRKEMIGVAMQQERFEQQMYDIARVEILDNLDTLDIYRDLMVLQSLLALPEYEPFYPRILYEMGRLEALRDVPRDFRREALSRIDMHIRSVDNSIYDGINMGSLNFVLAVFEYFLGRVPTQAEETECVNMVDGLTGILFQQEGSTKDDFLNIFFESDDYFEGQVRDIYLDNFFREPNSIELSEGTLLYKNTRKYEELVKLILSKDEYLGI